jgi:uncharacterized protein
MTQMNSPPASAARVIAPDLARGLMLLLIALANAPWHLYGYDTSGLSVHDPNGGTLDRIWQAVAIIAIDGRSYPLFAFLFGYGIWQLYRRQVDAGADRGQAHRLLRRRHLWMLLFGGVHAALLWGGDIIGAYGLVGLLVCWLFLDRADRTIAVWAGVFAGLLLLAGIASAAAGFVAGPDADSGGDFSLPNAAGVEWYPLAVLVRLGMWLGVTLGQGVLSLAVPTAVLLAILAARHRVLERPDLHRRMLAVVAVGGIAIAWAGGALSFAQFVGAITETPSWTFQILNLATGLAGGLGYAAVFGLVGAALQGRALGPVVRALTAVGKRSMTSYLLQSVLFVPVLAAWGLGLGGVLAEWQGALYGVGVWLVTVAIAVVLERRGQRGPFEVLLRRLAYPRARPRASVDGRS